jgi:polyisoprenyl-phosphate glycosyltransferase
VPPELSIVSPVYRAESCIAELHRRLTAVLAPMNVDYEIILVDDGSPDRSGELLEGIAAGDPRVAAVILSRNFGQHAAILAGLAEARGERIVVMDCDLQDRPEDVPLLLAKLDESADVVIARRLKRKTSALKRVTSRIWFALLNRLSAIRIEPGSGSFSALRRKVAVELLRMPNRHSHYQLVLLWLGFRQTYVDVDDGGRFEGRGAYSLPRLVSHALSGVVSHSTRLLYFSIYSGFVFVLLSIVQFAYVLVQKISNGVGVAGWASLMATMWLIGGAVLSSLGVIGIYLGRIVDDVKQRPAYIVSRRIRQGIRQETG